MSAGWSWYVIILTVANILGCVWLLWWTRRMRGDKPGGRDDRARLGRRPGRGQQAHAALVDQPLLHHHRLRASSTCSGIRASAPSPASAAGPAATARGRRRGGAGEARAGARAASAASRSRPSPRIAEAVELGRSVFANNCATCHGSDARGARGFPNLTDGDWQWGGDPDTVLDHHARRAPGRDAGDGRGARRRRRRRDDGLRAEPVRPAGATRRSPRPAARTSRRCASPVTAPMAAAIRCSARPISRTVPGCTAATPRRSPRRIGKGRMGQMPAHAALIGEDRARLAAAWVLVAEPRGALRCARHDDDAAIRASSAGARSCGPRSSPPASRPWCSSRCSIPAELSRIAWIGVEVDRKWGYTIGFFLFWVCTFSASLFTSILMRGTALMTKLAPASRRRRDDGDLYVAAPKIYPRETDGRFQRLRHAAVVRAARALLRDALAAPGTGGRPCCSTCRRASSTSSASRSGRRTSSISPGC